MTEKVKKLGREVLTAAVDRHNDRAADRKFSLKSGKKSALQKAVDKANARQR